MDEATRRARESFGEVAELYAAARPGYPSAVVDDLFALARLTSGSRVLEIGPGTGQLTVPLARRGLAVTAVELDADLAEIALRKLVGHPDVDMIVASFEDATLPDREFDLVVGATSLHWIDPSALLPKAGRVLKPGGTLAAIYSYHVAGGTEQFFVDVQECHERWDPATEPGLRLPSVDESPVDPIDLTSPLFGPPQTRRHVWDRTFTTAEYLDLLRTFSPTIALPPDARAGLLDCVGSLIDSRYGGSIVKRHLTELRAVRRR